MRLLLSIVTVVLVCLLPGSADAGIARVGRGIITTSAPPIYYVAPSPDDAGVSRMLYRKQDLAGLPPNVPITAIEFDKRLSGALATGALAIYMKNSAATSLPATSTVMDGLAGMTEVFTTTSPAIPAPSGWVRFTLTTPFTYTGDAIEVATVWDAMSGARSDDLLFSVHGTGTAFLEQFNYGPAPLAATDVIARSNPVTRVNTQLIFPDPTPGFLVVEVAKNPLQNGGTFTNNTTFAVGAAVPVAYTVRNIGLTSVSLAAVFTNVANMPTPTTSTVPAMLAAGGSVEIVVTHTPIAANVATGYTVTFDTDATDHVINLTGFAAATPAPEIQIEVCDENQVRCSLVPTAGQVYIGNAPVGEVLKLELNLGNIGSGTLTCADATIGHTNATGAITQQVAPTTPAGTDVVIEFEVTPTAVGPWSTQLRVDCNDASEPQYTVQINGKAVVATPPTAPDITVAYLGAAVGTNTEITTDVDEITLTLGNAGDADLVITAFETVDIVNASVPIVSQATLTIPPMSTVPITITSSILSATMAGGYQLRIVSNDPDETPFIVDVALQQGIPNIVTSYTRTDLFTQDPSPHSIALNLANTGTGDLFIDAVSVLEVTSNVEVVGQSGPGMTGIVLAPGESAQITFSLNILDPASTSDWRILVRVSSNDPDMQYVEVEMNGQIESSGTAADPGCFSASPSTAGPLLLVVALLLVRKPRRHRRLRAGTDLHG